MLKTSIFVVLAACAVFFLLTGTLEVDAASAGSGDSAGSGGSSGSGGSAISGASPSASIIIRIKEGLTRFETFLKALPLPLEFQASVEKIIRQIKSALNSFG